MGRNDFHIKADGTLGKGLVNEEELEGVIFELEDAIAAQNLALKAAQRAQTLKDRMLPMLKGSGFIVIDPTAPLFDGEEMEKIEDAQDHANNVAYKNGIAIIYAPISVVRPKREVATTTPSKLLQQLSLEQKGSKALPVSVVEAVPVAKAE